MITTILIHETAFMNVLWNYSALMIHIQQNFFSLLCNPVPVVKIDYILAGILTKEPSFSRILLQRQCSRNWAGKRTKVSGSYAPESFKTKGPASYITRPLAPPT